MPCTFPPAVMMNLQCVSNSTRMFVCLKECEEDTFLCSYSEVIFKHDFLSLLLLQSTFSSCSIVFVAICHSERS